MNVAMGNLARRLQVSRLRTALLQWRAHAGSHVDRPAPVPSPTPAPTDVRAVRLALALARTDPHRTTALKRTALAGWRGAVAAGEAEARWRERFGDLALFLRRRARTAQALAVRLRPSLPYPLRSLREQAGKLWHVRCC